MLNQHFRLDMRKTFSERAVRRWHRLHEEVLESLSLGAFKKRVAVALTDVVGGHSGNMVMFGLNYLFFNRDDSVICWLRHLPAYPCFLWKGYGSQCASKLWVILETESLIALSLYV